MESMQITSTISIAVEDERKGVQWGRFLHETDAPFQILFVVRGKSDTMRGLRDLFSACSRETTVRTEFKLFDCREGYTERRCEQIESKQDQNRCRAYAQMKRQQEYYLDVYMFGLPIAANDAQFGPRFAHLLAKDFAKLSANWLLEETNRRYRAHQSYWWYVRPESVRRASMGRQF